MGSDVRVTVIAAGFDRWDGDRPSGPTRSATATAETPAIDVFSDLGSDDDDDLDVPSFLK
jgi:cell division protein FtsZ